MKREVTGSFVSAVISTMKKGSISEEASGIYSQEDCYNSKAIDLVSFQVSLPVSAYTKSPIMSYLTV